MRLALSKIGDRSCGGPIGLGEDPVQRKSTLKPDRLDGQALGRFGYRVALACGDQARQRKVERDCSCGVAHWWTSAAPVASVLTYWGPAGIQATRRERTRDLDGGNDERVASGATLLRLPSAEFPRTEPVRGGLRSDRARTARSFSSQGRGWSGRCGEAPALLRCQSAARGRTLPAS